MEQRQIKQLIIVFTFLALVSLSVVYASLSRGLNIGGTAKINSKFLVELMDIQVVDKSAGTTSIDTNITNTTINFNVELTQPGDYIEYSIKVKNTGSINALLDSINRSVNNNDAIIFTTTGLKKGDELLINEEKTINIKISYAESITSQPKVVEESLEIELNFVQK